MNRIRNENVKNCLKCRYLTDIVLSRMDDEHIKYTNGELTWKEYRCKRPEGQCDFTKDITDLIEKAKKKLIEYLTWEKGWDGYGAAKLSKKNIDKGIEFLDILNKLSLSVIDIIPSPAPDGSFDIELYTEEAELTFTFYEGKETIVYFENHNS